MTALRRRMLEDMRGRNLAPNTQRVYLQYVAAFVWHCSRLRELRRTTVAAQSNASTHAGGMPCPVERTSEQHAPSHVQRMADVL